jgi:hypothetical protein
VYIIDRERREDNVKEERIIELENGKETEMGEGGPGRGEKDKVKREERHQKEKVFWNVAEDIATVR